MIAKLTRHGEGWALVLDAELLGRLEIGPETPLQVTAEGGVLVIAPAGDEERRVRFAAALEETNRRYGAALRRLAE